MLYCRIILCFLICLSSLYSQADLQKEKKKQYTWSSVSKALWDVKKKKFVSDTIDLHFQCSDGDKIQVSVLRLSENLAPFPVIIKIQTGYVPPSGTGYMQFIYTAEWSADRGKLLVHQQNQNITEDFMRLRTQVFKNQKIGKEEYQEKIQYCETLQESQKCFSSASGYQVGEASMALELDFGKNFEKLYFIFDPVKLNNVEQLHCYPKKP